MISSTAEPGDCHYSGPQQSFLPPHRHRKEPGSPPGPPCLLPGQEHPAFPDGDRMCQWVHRCDLLLFLLFFKPYSLVLIFCVLCLYLRRMAPVLHLLWGPADQSDPLQLQRGEGRGPLQLSGHHHARQSQTLLAQNHPERPRTAFPAGYRRQQHSGPHCEGLEPGTRRTLGAATVWPKEALMGFCCFFSFFVVM